MTIAWSAVSPLWRIKVFKDFAVGNSLWGCPVKVSGNVFKCIRYAQKSPRPAFAALLGVSKGSGVDNGAKSAEYVIPDTGKSHSGDDFTSSIPK